MKVFVLRWRILFLCSSYEQCPSCLFLLLQQALRHRVSIVAEGCNCIIDMETHAVARRTCVKAGQSLGFPLQLKAKSDPELIHTAVREAFWCDNMHARRSAHRSRQAL